MNNQDNFNKIEQTFNDLVSDYYADDTTRRFVASAQLREDYDHVNPQFSRGTDFVWIPLDVGSLINRFEFHRGSYLTNKNSELYHFYALDKNAQKLYEAALIYKHALVFGTSAAVYLKLSDFEGKMVPLCSM